VAVPPPLVQPLAQRHRRTSCTAPVSQQPQHRQHRHCRPTSFGYEVDDIVGEA